MIWILIGIISVLAGSAGFALYGLVRANKASNEATQKVESYWRNIQSLGDKVLVLEAEKIKLIDMNSRIAAYMKDMQKTLDTERELYVQMKVRLEELARATVQNANPKQLAANINVWLQSLSKTPPPKDHN